MGSYTAGSFFELLKWALCPFFNYRDVMYAAAAWMQNSGYVQGRNVCRGCMDAEQRRITMIGLCRSTQMCRVKECTDNIMS